MSLNSSADGTDGAPKAPSRVDMFRYNYFLKKRGGSHSSLHRDTSTFFRTETEDYDIGSAPILSEKRQMPSVEDDIILDMYAKLLDVITNDIETTAIKKQIKKPDPTLGYCDASLYSGSQDNSLSSPSSLSKKSSAERKKSLTRRRSSTSSKSGAKKVDSKLSMGSRTSSSEKVLSVIRESSTTSFASEATHVSTLSALPEWKPLISDEEVTIDFKNGAVYIGRLSRKCMEGPGLYRYPDGTIYEGEFVDNIPQGNGAIMWPDMSVYIGTFHQGYRHGTGFFSGPPVHSNEKRVFLSGTWQCGKLQGKGTLQQGEMIYEGEFKNGKRTGFATRYYGRDNVYNGYFEDGTRNGHGTMVWPNNDMYIGNWHDGFKDGYGDYIWNTFNYPDLCFFNQNMYSGNWLRDFKHGFGTLFLSTGVIYDGNWEKDQKHGMGLVVCKNGLIVKSDPLFWENKVAPMKGDEQLGNTSDPKLTFKKRKTPKSEKSTITCSSISSAASSRPKELKETSKESIDTSAFPPTMQELGMLNKIQNYVLNTRRKLADNKYQPRSIPLNLPDHHIMLEYHLNRVKNNDPLHAKFKVSHLVNISYDPKVSFHTAPFDPSCSNIYNLDIDECNSPEIDIKVKTKPPQVMPAINSLKPDFNIVESEEYFLRNMLTYHVAELRSIYDKYASIGLRADCPMNQKPVLVRMFLWQFFRDCGIQYKGIKLIQLDRCISENVSSCVLYDHAPFERIQFFQFLHAILEVAWLLYGRYMNVCATQRGVLATSLDMFLRVDVFPGIQVFAGKALFAYRDRIPMEAVRNLYNDIGDPPKVRDFLNVLQEHWDDQEQTLETLPKTITGSRRIVEGSHSVIVDTIIFNPGPKKNLLQDSISKLPLEEPLPWNLTGLKVIKDLTVNDVLQCCTDICPGVLCNEIIADIDYELTLLEFYEIIISCVDRIFFNAEYMKWKVLEDARVLKLTKLLKQTEGKKGKAKGGPKDKKKKK